MHIVFGYVLPWQISIMKVLRYFKFHVYYLHIDVKTETKKNEIATKLKKNNIYPLAIESEKKILPNAGFEILFSDPNEFSYKKNIKLVPDRTLKKFSNLFSIHEKNAKKLRLLLQDFVYTKQLNISSLLGVWSALYPQKKIIYVSFDFKCFYMSDTSRNIFKIIIPVNFLNYFIKIINPKKIFLLFSGFANKKNEKHEKQMLNKQNYRELEKKNVAFIMNRGLIYGTKNELLFKKSLYYSDNEDSCLNKNNILHLDYDNYLSPEEGLHWVCLKKVKVSNSKIFFKSLLASVKTCYLIRNWSTFLGWLLCIKQYNNYLKYCEAIKKFKNLKIAIIDYDILCPKALILALEKNNIKTVATQERFIHTFCTSFANVVVDTYYVVSEFAANFIKKSKYYDVKNLIAVGSYRTDYLSLYKNAILPEEISKAKKKGKKILTVLGYHPPCHWFESNTSIEVSWSSQITFLEDIIKLSQQLNNTFIVMRFKTMDWAASSYFKKILKKINDSENIVISNNYKEPFYTYKLCTNADLIITKHTSVADECLANGIPVLFYEYGHNHTKIMSDVFNYLSSGLMCYNFEELLERSKSLLFNNSSKLKDEIAALNKTIYHVKERGNIKNKIIGQLENLIHSTS
tara:strand:+ start:175 stop:2061 length:1887 start_codon:yes stop_codon:yes gene_type:complete